MGSHTCEHCQVPLKLSSTRLARYHYSRIRFPHSVKDARRAARDGCPIFEAAVSQLDQRSIRVLLRAHILAHIFGRRVSGLPCSCCDGFRQRCRYILRSLSSTPFQLLISLPRVSLDCGDCCWASNYNVYTYTGNPASAVLPSFDLEVNSSQTICDVQKWLRECTCMEKEREVACLTVPSRIIDVGDKAEPDCVTVMPTNDLSRTSSLAYVCLSYYWGGPQHVRCTKERVAASESWSIPMQLLPDLLRDAITVTRQLGFRYLWIDSLCIVQDDPTDFEREILKMPNIYKNSQLTICASTSRSCHDGFLDPRPDYSEYQIQLSFADGQQGTMFADLLDRPPAPEPLSTRAWAFQERLLSPRLLEYGWRTARWSCRCSRLYSGHDAPPNAAQGSCIHENNLAHILDDLLTPLSNKYLRHLVDHKLRLEFSWIDIVRQYSSLDLTFPDDRLAAIGGIAAELQAATGVSYLAGLWEFRLPVFLQWRVTSKADSLRPRPSNRARAPSWSWVAVDNSVEFTGSRDDMFGLAFNYERFHVVSVDVSGGFGTSAQGTIVLEGPVRPAFMWCGDGTLAISSEYRGGEPRDFEYITWGEHNLDIWPDCAEEVATYDNGKVTLLAQELVFLAIGHTGQGDSKHDVRGLLLRQLPESYNYMRVGLFQAQPKGVFEFEKWDVERVSII